MIKDELTETATPSTPKSGRFFTTFLVALLAGATLYLGINRARHGAGIASGASAPPFKLARYGGGTVSLDDLKGKVVMLDFWATWCPPCVAEIPMLTKLTREYEPKGLVLLAANRDAGDNAPVDVGIFVAQRAPELAKSVVFADDTMAASYRVESLPTVYFIGRDGRILEGSTGYASESAMRRRIESALSK